MIRLKRGLGICWMALGPIAIFYLLRTAAAEIARKPVLDTEIQWAVFILIFLPIALGLMIFGYYVLKGEYEGGNDVN